MKNHIIICCMWIPALLFGADISSVKEEMIPFKRGKELMLTANEGEVSIQGWDKDSVSLKMTKIVRGFRPNEVQEISGRMKVDVKIQSGRLVIREYFEKSERQNRFLNLFHVELWPVGRQRQIDFELKVPRHIKINVQCDEGDVVISDLEAKVTVSVDEGDVELTDLRGPDVSVESDEGDINIQSCLLLTDSELHAECDEGDIHISGGRVTKLYLSSDEGDIRIDKTEIKEARISLDEGDIFSDIIPQIDGDYQFESDEGSIDIQWPDSIGVRTLLRSEDGRIRSNVDLRVSRHGDGERIKGIVGNSEQARVKATSDEGDIHFNLY